MKALAALLFVVCAAANAAPVGLNQPRIGSPRTDPVQLEAAAVGKIRYYLVMPPSLKGNPRVEVKIFSFNSGGILGSEVTSPSADPAFDRAVIAAIAKAEVLRLPFSSGSYSLRISAH